jgi:hypothetical protein
VRGGRGSGAHGSGSVVIRPPPGISPGLASPRGSFFIFLENGALRDTQERNSGIGSKNPSFFESVAAICGQESFIVKSSQVKFLLSTSFIVKVERIGIYIHQEISLGAGAWLVVCHTTSILPSYRETITVHCAVPIFLIWHLKWAVPFEILAIHCRDYFTSRFCDSN